MDTLHFKNKMTLFEKNQTGAFEGVLGKKKNHFGHPVFAWWGPIRP
jgi:hypothetical protein